MEPTSIYQGDSVTWARSVAGYSSADGWDLKYHFAAPTHALPDVTGVPDGSGGWEITVPAIETALWDPDVYQWHARVSLGAEVATVDTGEIEVLRSLEGVDRDDGRSFAARALEQVEAAILASAGSDVVSWSLGGRSGTRLTRDEALAYRDRLRAEVAREQRAAEMAKGRPHTGRILARL